MTGSIEDKFRDELVDGEVVKWTGQPVRRVHLATGDLLFVPMGLLALSFAVYWPIVMLVNEPAIPTGPRYLSLILTVPMFLIAFHLLVLRFFLKSLRKKRTYYAVTNKRILAMRTGRTDTLQSLLLSELPSIVKSVRKDGIGTIRFGTGHPAVLFFENTGIDLYPSINSRGGISFFDINGASEVYNLVNRLRSDCSIA